MKLTTATLLLAALVASAAHLTAGAQDRGAVAVAAGPRPRAVIEERIRSAAARLETERELARWAGLEISGAGPDGFYELMSYTGGVPLYLATTNEDAARSTRTDSVLSVHSGGGAGMVVGLWDAGAPRVSHQEFGGRAEWRDERSYITHPHATHVGGTMIAAGVRAGARGMAPGASLIAYEWSFDDLETELEAGAGLLISNHSYGYVRGWVRLSSGAYYWFGDLTVSETVDYLFGFYSHDSRVWDEVCNRNPYYLPVTSAGNDRNDGVEPGTEHYAWDPVARSWVLSRKVRDNDGAPDGYDCIPDGMGIAKNTLTVGAVTDVVKYDGPADVEMTVFSSWGPADDGRIKPDISANGFDLLSCLDQNDESYGRYSGTSMAAPNVSGSLALLQSRYRELRGAPMLASTVKALAIHTAREAGPHPGPDYAFGWGLLDAWGAFELIEADPDGRLGLISEFTLHDGRPLEFHYEPLPGAARFVVTICWNDPAGAPPAPAVDPRDPMLVNDLDLRISSNGNTWQPWVLDPDLPAAPAGRGDNRRDNVEQIVVENPAAGRYAARISHKGTLAGGSQRVSMIVSGARRVRAWHVFADGSGDAPTIAEAVLRAAPGDQVLVFPGVYNEHGITIDKDLFLSGVDGAEATIVNAGRRGRCLIVRSAAVHVEGLTLEDGLADGPAQGGRGGGIYCDGADAVIASCIVRGCKATVGGGIYARGRSPALLDCGIYLNRAASAGGGVYLERAGGAIERCGIYRNLAARGGGIYCEDSSPLISECTLAHNGDGPGAGILMAGRSAPRIERTIIAFGAGGEGLRAEGTLNRPVVECCNVYGNARGDFAGALSGMAGRAGNFSADPVFCDPEALVYTLGDGSPCLPRRNACGVLIGAAGVGCHTLRLMLVEPDGSGDAATIAEAVERAQPGDSILLGPGVFAGPGNRDIRVPVMPLVITSRAGPAETVIDCGGDEYYGFYFSGGHDTLTVLEGVTITGAGNGAVVCYDRAAPLVRRCILTGNRFTGGSHGGGVICESNARPLFRECAIVDNLGDPNGGGVLCKNAAPEFVDCLITGNSATRSGGGVASMSSAHPVFRRCTITANAAIGDDGGGVYVIMGSATLVDCHVTDNTAAKGGGGIFSGASGILNVSGTVIARNLAATVGGGVHSLTGMTMTGCSVVRNRAESYGAGIQVLQGTQNLIRETIVAFNLHTQGVYTIMGAMDIRCSNVYGNEGGDYGGSTPDMTDPYNLSDDPLFCDLETGDYHLDESSPVLAPPDPSCAPMMGALGVRCGSAPDLYFSRVEFDADERPAGSPISVTAVTRNAGTEAAAAFTIDFFADLDTAPAPGMTGTRRTFVASLAAGDSIVWSFEVSSAAAAAWRSWILLDSELAVPELNRDNNVAGPFALAWSGPEGDVPSATRLRGVRPNPFNGETLITWDLARRESARIEIFDLTGRRVRIWKFPPSGPGSFSVAWNGRDEGGRPLASGVYFCRLYAAGARQTVKIVLLR